MHSRFMDEAIAAVEKLDDEVRSCKPDFPHLFDDAVAFAAALLVNDKSVSSQIECFVVVCKQCYRLGYKNGRQDLQTQLTSSANEG